MFLTYFYLYMPVYATSVIFGVFAMPEFSGIFCWNLPAGQYSSQPCQKVHICMSHSQPINYIVYSVREKTCTAPDLFVYFLDYHCIGQQGISSFILYANQTDTKRFVHAIFCDFACF